MIRLLLLMWCHAVLVMVARGEVTERAYYLGAKESLIWAIPQEERNGGPDPFATDSDSDLMAGQLLSRLKKAPFESRYISEGDELWDMAAELKKIPGEEISIEQAIFNQTTRRLILRGNEAAFDRFDSFAFGIIRDIPRMIQLKARVYLAPRKSYGLSSWNGVSLGKSHQSLAEVEMVVRPGIKADFEGEEGILKMSFEPHVGAMDDIIDTRLEISGEVKGNSFSLQTGLTLWNAVSGVIELGSIGDGETLLLSLEPEIYLVGGVKLREVILDEHRPIESPLEKLATHSVEEDWTTDSETGKVFRSFHVPPTILSFLDTGGDSSEDEADPFATDSPSVSRKKFPYVKSWNSKVIAGPAARVVDMKPILALQGVPFAKEDFAYFVENSATVYAETNWTNMELVDLLIGMGGLVIPRQVACSVTLIEGEKKIEVGDLKREDLRCVVKSGLVARPGQSSTLELGSGSHSVSVELEPQIGANDDYIDLRGRLKWSEGKETRAQWTSGVTLISGKKQIVSSYRKGGKWYALLIEMRTELMTDWLRGE